MAKVRLERYQSAVDLSEGWCSSCERWTADQVEPDAEGYECPRCGERTVLGAEQALIVGALTVKA